MNMLQCIGMITTITFGFALVWLIFVGLKLVAITVYDAARNHKAVELAAKRQTQIESLTAEIAVLRKQAIYR